MNIHIKLNKELKTYQLLDHVVIFIVIKIKKLCKSVKTREFKNILIRFF